MTGLPVDATAVCLWCSGSHSGLCPLVAAIEYYPDGKIRRIEFVKVPRAGAADADNNWLQWVWQEGGWRLVGAYTPEPE